MITTPGWKGERSREVQAVLCLVRYVDRGILEQSKSDSLHLPVAYGGTEYPAERRRVMKSEARKALEAKSKEELDELIHEIKSMEASMINNNNGRLSQIDYLLECGWDGE